MLQRLRRRIVLITMLLVGLVIALACAAIIGFVYHTEYQDIHAALKRATQNGPEEVAIFSVGGRYPGGWSDAEEVVDSSGTTLPITAVFRVDGGTGEILDSNAEIVSMNESVRDVAITQVLSGSSDEGQLRTFGVFYMKRSLQDGTVIIAFCDALSFDRQILSIAEILGCVCLVALVALLVASTLLARLVTRPVERAWEQQRRFVADASHELKTPLTVIIASNDILKGRPDLTVGEQMRWIEGTAAEATRMRGLIEDMLTLARDEESNARESRQDDEELDLSALVGQASLAFDAVAFEAGVEVREDIAPGLGVRGDRASLERLVKTLLDNAVKYAGAGGVVQVRLVAGHKGRPVLTVNNTGPAIPKQELPHVFDRFWRSDAARTHKSGGGYGLGLAIAKSIAESHGARISVTSTEQEGTTFTVAF